MGRPAKDWTGTRVGRLTAIKRVGSAADGHVLWLCKCDCGNYTTITSNMFTRDLKYTTKSCGCLCKEVASEKAKKRYKDLTGQQFNRLTAKEYLGNGLWRCECSCGNKNFITTSHHLLSGNTQSCGCLKSKGEDNIAQLLRNNNIEFIQQKTFPDLNYESKIPVRFDFFLPAYNRLIEYDGIQHYQPDCWKSVPLSLIQKRDNVRNKYALAHNIPLVRIPYWMRDKITLDMLLGDEYLVKEVPNDSE